MKVKTLRIGHAQTINMGNYESVRPEVMIEIEIAEDESLEPTFDVLHKTFMKIFKEHRRRMLEESNQKSNIADIL